MSIQEASWKIKWTLDRIDLALERMNETKYTVQLDDKSVLEVKSLHLDLLAKLKSHFEDFKRDLDEAFTQYRKEMKEITQGQGLWVSNKALAIALVTIEVLFFVVGLIIYLVTKARFT